MQQGLTYWALAASTSAFYGAFYRTVHGPRWQQLLSEHSSGHQQGSCWSQKCC